MILKLFRFLTGLTRRSIWPHLWRILVSPKLHLAMTLDSVTLNLITASLRRRLASWAYGLGLLAFVATTGLWPEFLIAYVLPVGILFTMGAVLQTVSEHTWVHTGQGRDPKRQIWSRLTRNRFFGEMPPESGEGWFAWAKLVGPDAVHTRTSEDLGRPPGPHGSCAASHATERSQLAAYRLRSSRCGSLRGCARHAISRGVGLANALSLTFDHLALVPPEADLGEPSSDGWIDPDLWGCKPPSSAPGHQPGADESYTRQPRTCKVPPPPFMSGPNRLSRSPSRRLLRAPPISIIESLRHRPREVIEHVFGRKPDTLN